MNSILSVILASIFSLPVAVIFSLIGIGILFHAPFTSTPLFGRLPDMSERFCPAGSSLVVERYGRSSDSQSKNYHRAICLDSTGKRVADVSLQVDLAALVALAAPVYLIAWLVFFRLVKGSVQKRHMREKWFMLGTLCALAVLAAWAAPYVYRQPTHRESEQALMVVLAVVIVFAAVFLTAHHYLRKMSGGKL